MTKPPGVISGRLADRPVADLLESLHESRHTAEARFRTALGTATVWFRDGDLIDAEMGRFHQEAAVLRLLKIQDGEFEVESGPVSRRRAVKAATAQLLAEGRQRAPRPGRAVRRRATLPESDGEQAAMRARRQVSSGRVRAGQGDTRIGTPPRAVTPTASTPPGVRRSPTPAGARATPVDPTHRSPTPAGARATPVDPTRRSPTPAGARTTPVDPTRRSPTPAGTRRAPTPAGTPVATGPRRSPTPAGTPVVTGPRRSPTPAGTRRAPTPAGTPVATGPRRSPTPAGLHTPRPSDTDAHTIVAGAPHVIPTDHEDDEEHPTIRAHIPADSELARQLGRSSSSTEVPRARVPSSPDIARARVPSNPGVPVGTRRPSSADVPRARVPSNPGVPVGTRRPSSADVPRARVPSNPGVPGPVEDPAQGSGPSRPGRRREAASWSPTAGSDAAKAPPPQPEPPAAAMGRTQFLFGVPDPPPAPPRAPRFGAGEAELDEPPNVDRTLMRPGPVPPPPTATPTGRPRQPSQPSIRPTPSQPIDVGASPDPGETITYGRPTAIEEEYSHPISVPSDPSNLGPGGTWMFGGSMPGVHAPPIEEPDEADRTFVLRQPAEPAEPEETDKTMVLRQSDVPRSRPSPVSAQVQGSPGGGRTAQVGRYEVLLRLARGGMGTVYLCRITGEGGFRRLFALKVIREHLNRNQAYVDMLLEEARIASRLNHPNIVPILDIDTFAGQHFLVMDYVEGCTFSELLKAQPKSRPPALVVPIIVDALTGLHAAHTMRGDDGTIQPLVHCDFSPQNMLVGMNGTCRIIDFGVAKAADALPTRGDRGKPRYLSPEQVRGLPLDPRSDVFSAGVVLWNALTGERLFDGETTEQILHQVVSAKIPKPSTVGLRPPACFDRVCLKALERDPGRRYQSAEQMLMDLRKVAIAEDMLAASSEVGQWVLDTFGAQIEHRRLAAGLGSDAVASVISREPGPSGHADAREGSETGENLDASRTLMLRSEGGEPVVPEEGLGPRTRIVVLVAAFVFIAAGVLTLFIRPDLLQGGIVDENHTYIEVGSDPDATPAADASGDGSGGADGAAGTGGETEAVPADEDSGEATTESDDAGASGGEAEADDGGKPARDGKGSKGKDPKGGDKGKDPKDPKDGDKGKDPKGKDPKGEEPVAPPPDLDELFKQPGG